jgi:hypothetical protein
MSRSQGWKVIIDRFHQKLSKWKANTLSIGGRFMLISSVLGSSRYLLHVSIPNASTCQTYSRICTFKIFMRKDGEYKENSID